MAVVVAIVVIVALLFLGGAVTLFVLLGKRQAAKKSSTTMGAGAMAETPSDASPGFRWKYVLLPLVLFIFTVAAAVYFYPLLPARIGYHFGDGGSPDAWVDKGLFVALMLVLQLILSVAAGAIGLIVTKLAEMMKAGSVSIRSLGGVIAVMTNMVALPQLLVFFVVLDIFTYNAYGAHFLSSAILATLVIVLGSFVLVFFFYRAMQQTRTTK